MYSLRSINNHYADSAGTRTDFIVVGDPGFQGGRVTAGKYGLAPGPERPSFWNGPRDLQVPLTWDTSPPKSHPGGSVAKSRSLGALVRQVAYPEAKASLRERAMTRSSSSPALPSMGSPSASGMAVGNFEAFLAELNEDGKRAGFSRATVGCRRHVDSMNQELAEIRRRLKQNPEATKQDLRDHDSWKYYALHLGRARQLKGVCRREAPKSVAIAEKAYEKNSKEIPAHRRGYHVSLA